ncbi:MAG: SBBP repeat-containing protein [Acidobacteria bacterium]|nr:SBBP repeat-containing protein [Acidobacteriota bacterium]
MCRGIVQRLLLAVMVLTAPVLSQIPATAQNLLSGTGGLPVSFEINRGQLDERVRFFTRNSRYNLYLTATDAVYVIPDPSPDAHRAVAVYMRMTGADPNSLFAGTDELPGRTNYLKGNDPAGWRTDVPTFGGVLTTNVYPGVDVAWHGNRQNQLQYDFSVAPGARPEQIEWQIEGAQDVAIDADGNLVITTEFGVLKQLKPFTYQERNGLRAEVASRFEKRGANRVGFAVDNYDPEKTLVIDPSVTLNLLAFSTYLGGVGNDQGLDIKTDAAGNVYVTGYTLSPLFPTTPGSYDTSQNANEDVFVTKLNASATQLIFSTFIGGSGTDEASAIELDGSNNIYLTGYTTSSAYPTTAGAFDTTANGSADVFVTKLNPTGTALIYSTYIGGNVFEEAFDLTRDSSNNVYVTGRTNGGTFPVTVGAFDTSFNGGQSDVFVCKLDVTGANLVYSTFLGGDALDYGEGIAVDSGGNAYIAGFTQNGTVVDYPFTAGAFQTTYQGGTNDMFVTKLNALGSVLSYSTFLGGTDSDSASDIAIDSNGNAYIVGNVLNGGGFPVTVGAYDTTHNGAIDTAVCELNSTGSALVFSTFIGGNGSDVATAIAIDASGSPYVTGYTLNSVGTNYPATAGAYQTSHNGGHDAYLSRFSPNGSTLLYSTFLGGLADDQANGIALDANGNVFLAGMTTTTATTPFPTSLDAYQNFYGGAQDVFVAKFGDLAISGRTVDQAGLPLANTAVSLSGMRSGFMLTDAQGYFGFSDTIFNGSFNVAAVSTNYNFTPNNFPISPLLTNTELTFVGRPTSSGPTFSYAQVGGKVQSTVGAAPLGNTTLTLIDTVHPENTRTVTTDNLGKYNFSNVAAGAFYIVVPQREGFNFNPGVYDMAILGDQPNLDFAATPNNPRPVNDFDGDGKSDLAVFRPSDGNWYVLNSQTNGFSVTHFGAAGDVPVAEDFDGDRRTDFAVYRPSEGNWYRLMSSQGFSAVNFGIAGDQPVAADYDGDGKSDIAVWRPASGVWHRLNSSDGSYTAFQFGIAADRPLAADFDGDGKADPSVYRGGTWYRLNSANGSVAIFNFGLSTDKPLAGDFDGDGRADVAVWRPSNGVWYSVGSAGGEFAARAFGQNGDLPVPLDFDGDGKTDPAVYRGGTWYITRAGGAWSVSQFGLTTDIPNKAVQ